MLIVVQKQTISGSAIDILQRLRGGLDQTTSSAINENTS